MASLTYGLSEIEGSITNPETVVAHSLDNASPLSFFDFLQHTNQTASATEFNNAYKLYLAKWYELRGSQGAEIIAQVKDQYIELLQDITLNYTTLEEKRFLSNLDLKNQNDLAIGIPFYSRKITEICNFFNDKREDLKHKIEQNKIKGTITSVEKAVFDNIITTLFTDEDYQNYRISNLPLSSISAGFKIEVEEYYDTYTNYFNIDPDLSSDNYDVTNVDREEMFSSNTNEIKVDVFLDFDAKLKAEIFDFPIIISELGDIFSVNYNTQLIDLECDTDSSINDIINDRSKTSNLKLKLQKKLITKYIGTDFYYLSTNSTNTQFVSGILFKADAPNKNLLNRRFPTTATIPNNNWDSARDIGLFFKPDKLGVLYFTSPTKRFYIDTKKIEASKVYIFPDPEIYGNISNITGTPYEYPLYYSIDNTTHIKNQSYQYIYGDIKSNPYDQLTYGYISTQNLYQTKQTNLSGLSDNFTPLFDNNIITDWKSDIYGNQFALFKNAHNNKRNIDRTLDTQSSCIIFDGHVFHDDKDGPTFDYSINSGQATNGSIRTGVTARTIDEIPDEGGNFSTGYSFNSGAMFALTGAPIYYLHFREFFPYTECTSSNNVVRCKIYDAGQFTFLDGSALPDPYSADDSVYNTAVPYYYTLLLEGGVASLAVPLERSIKDTPSLSANMSLSPPISAGELVDGRNFTESCNTENDYPFINKSQFYSSTLHKTGTTIFDPATGEHVTKNTTTVKDLTGVLFVRNIENATVSPASAALVNIFSKYPDNITEELNYKIKSFDLIYDRLFITTENYFIIDKIVYDGDQFIKPNTRNYSFDQSINSQFTKISNPFFIENEKNVYFVRTNIVSELSSTNAKTIYPEIYKFNISKHINQKIFPAANTTNEELSGYFSLSALDVNIVRISKPSLTHNTRNDRYSITYIGEDGNNAAYIFNTIFKFDDQNVNILTTNAYRFATNNYTHNFFQSTSAVLVSASFAGESSTQTLTAGTYNFN